MIVLHRLGGQEVTVNAELIETVQAVPNTLINLTTGNKLIVQETVEEVMALARAYRRDVNGKKGPGYPDSTPDKP